jgi:hypothetical protein
MMREARKFKNDGKIFSVVTNCQYSQGTSTSPGRCPSSGLYLNLIVDDHAALNAPYIQNECENRGDLLASRTGIEPVFPL